jgi:hypothetical protein
MNSDDSFKLTCRMLRNAGKLDMRSLKPPRPSESLVDWLVRAGIAHTPQDAAEGLLRAAGLTSVRDELQSLDIIF